VDIRVGTFNLNNLFSRFDLYTEVDPPIASDTDEATKENPRPWLSGPTLETDYDGVVEILSRGTIGPDGKLQWRRTFKGKLIRGTDLKAQQTIARRIKELDVDVLGVQEVENLEALEDFVSYFGLRDAGFRHLALVEGHDKRLIDVGLSSKLYDQIWASPDLGGKLGKAWIPRRTLRGGNASDHDPTVVEVKGI
jgi:hypothetical protein